MTSRRGTTSRRDVNKRLKGIGIPIEICVKFERLIGLKPGEEPNYVQKILISEEVIKAMREHVKNIHLTSEDHELITQEVRKNEGSRG